MPAPRSPALSGYLSGCRLGRPGGVASLVMAALLLAGCSKPGPDLQAAFSSELPKTWQVESFKVLAETDTGTKVSPRREYRFEAAVSPRTDLLRSRGVLQQTEILEVVLRKGQSDKVIGTAVAQLHGEQWQANFRPEKAPMYGAGRSPESFTGKQVVLGTSDYRSLLTTARKQLSDQQARLEAEAAAWQQGVVAHQQLSRELQEQNQQSAREFDGERQRLQKQWQEAQIKSRQERLTREREQQAALNERLQPLRQQHEGRLAELDKNHRLLVADLQAQRQRLQQEQNAGRKALRDTFNATQSEARKRLDSASYTLQRAQADEKLRADLAGLETTLAPRFDELKARETAAANDRRTAVEQQNAAFRQAADGVRTASSATAGSPGAAPAGQAPAGHDEVAAIEQAQKAAQQRHQKLQQDNGNRLQAARRELDQKQRQLGEARRQWQNEQKLLEELESPRPAS